ncbi:hypothetical protein CXF51_18025 [Bacillus subtilis subsp. subtilis]|nr:hypothetical protein CXF51_18025 [Bacillus subtilis subsp. subtilis]
MYASYNTTAYPINLLRKSSEARLIKERKTEPFRNGAVASNFLKGFFWELERYLGLLDYSENEEKIKKINLFTLHYMSFLSDSG